MVRGFSFNVLIQFLIPYILTQRCRGLFKGFTTVGERGRIESGAKNPEEPLAPRGYRPDRSNQVMPSD